MISDPEFATFVTGIVTGFGLGVLLSVAVAYLLGRREVYVSTNEQAVIDMHRDGLPVLLMIADGDDVLVIDESHRFEGVPA